MKTHRRIVLAEFEISGAQHHAPIDEAEVGDALRIVREPENVYDSDACALEHRVDGRIGYVPRVLAQPIAALIDAGFDVRAKLTYSGACPRCRVYLRVKKQRPSAQG